VISAKVKGANRLRRKLTRLPLEATKNLRIAVTDEAAALAAEMQALAPVSSWERSKPEVGHMGESIGWAGIKQGLAAKIGLFGPAGKVFFYARFVEFGTKKMAAQPFVRPAWIRRLPAVQLRMREAVKDAIDTVVHSWESDD
jgi:HK97 gp10 family phage protein